jgi:hypothetical protein
MTRVGSQRQIKKKSFLIAVFDAVFTVTNLEMDHKVLVPISF